ncbi:hypothetical protein [Thiothrix caldifontis]|uniref:hypothetical protein n=1 Tax=Thiothrix caldifontis TaxID=525918 RepID=UPI00111499DD|nr:hypothetical protein [Thiothrix caldifontis]
MSARMEPCKINNNTGLSMFNPSINSFWEHRVTVVALLVLGIWASAFLYAWLRPAPPDISGRIKAIIQPLPPECTQNAELLSTDALYKNCMTKN